jgi:ABC-type lipoprotein release transport system permease subunit
MLFLRLAWRNLWRNPWRTAIVLTAVTVGIAGVVLSMAINNGLVRQMVENAIATEVGHLQIHASGFDRNPVVRIRLKDGGRASADVLRSLPDVRAWAPRVTSEGLIFSPRASVGVRVVGIDPGKEATVSILARSIVDGTYLDTDGATKRILMGETLAHRLHVSVGDKVVVSVQDLSGDLTGEAFRVAGLFRTPSLEFDRGTVFMRLDHSQQLFGLGDAISEIVIIAQERSQIGEIRDVLERRLGAAAEVKTWEELRPMLLQTVEIFDSVAWYVYAAIFVAMVFGIANVLLMAVFERIREIGILMAIGMRPRRLLAMILAESLILTAAGLSLGYGVAVGTVAALHNGIDLSFWASGLTAAGIGTRIVPVIRSYDVVIPIGIAILTAVVASLWPALRAARLRPAQAVRYV